jgi:hypothetical protein
VKKTRRGGDVVTVGWFKRNVEARGSEQASTGSGLTPGLPDAYNLIVGQQPTLS